MRSITLSACFISSIDSSRILCQRRSYPQFSHMRACRKYWLMAVSSFVSTWFRRSMTFALPFMKSPFPEEEEPEEACHREADGALDLRGGCPSGTAGAGLRATRTVRGPQNGLDRVPAVAAVGSCAGRGEELLGGLPRTSCLAQGVIGDGVARADDHWDSYGTARRTKISPAISGSSAMVVSPTSMTYEGERWCRRISLPGMTPSAASRSMRSWKRGMMKTMRAGVPSSKLGSPVTSGRTVFCSTPQQGPRGMDLP